jgi:hypothetical protein
MQAVTSQINIHGMPRARFDKLPEVFQYGQYWSWDTGDNVTVGFKVEWGGIEIQFYLDASDRPQYCVDKCLV